MPEMSKHSAVIVAHPDDETLWCGGQILLDPGTHWHILTLCRGSDPDRAPKFARVCDLLGATGTMGDLDDGPDQNPMPTAEIGRAITSLLPPRRYDLVLTHGPLGEYTRHRRHEECCRAVVDLWSSGGLETAALWMFAFEDENRTVLPRVRSDAHRRVCLPDEVWREKQRMITEVYGFSPESWEAKATPREEGFWCFDSPTAAVRCVHSHKASP